MMEAMQTVKRKSTHPGQGEEKQIKGGGASLNAERKVKEKIHGAGKR